MQMKKKIAGVLAVLMLLFVCLPGQADVQAKNELAYDPLDVYNGLIGNVYFALPGASFRLEDADMEGKWTNSYQLWGNCGTDGAEFQLRTADIGPWIAGYQEAYPDESYEENALQALYGYASMMIEMMGGTITGPKAAISEDFLYMVFDYTYADTPNAEYRASCVLDGSRAVCLCAEQCEHGKEAISRLGPATEEQKAAFAARRPETVGFFGLSVTFPYSPTVTEHGNGTMALCFTDDFTLISADYIPVGINIDASEEEVRSSLQMLADQSMQSVGGEKAEDGVLSGSADTLWQLDYTGKADFGYGEQFAQEWVGRVCVGEKGVWYFKATDTETGRAFMQSVGKAPEAPDGQEYTGLWIEGAAALAEERPDDGTPATLYQFTRDLYALLSQHAYGCASSPEDIKISQAFYSDGAWKRTVSVESADIFAVLSMASESERAFVNGLNALGVYDADLNAFLAFAACCAEAAEGSAARDPLTAFVSAPAEGEIYSFLQDRYHAQYFERDPEGTELKYRGVFLEAHAAAPGENDIPYPGDGADMVPFASPSVTVEEFLARWEALNQAFYHGAYPLMDLEDGYQDDDGSYVQVYLADGSAGVAVTADGEDKSALISRLMVIDYAGDAPIAFLSGLMSLYAVSDMPMDTFVSLCMALTEYPLFQDLSDMWPIGAWNGCMLLTGEIEVDTGDGADTLPAAWVVGIPAEAEAAE